MDERRPPDRLASLSGLCEVVSRSARPLNRLEPQSPSLHFFAKFFSILFDAVTGKSVSTARLFIEFDLPPNAVVERQKTICLRLRKIHHVISPPNEKLIKLANFV